MTFSLLARPVRGAFGIGAEHPYELGLLDAARTVRLLNVDDRRRGRGQTLDLGRFRGAPDDTDRSVLQRTHGPVLDIGCGPARLVEAAVQAGRSALGVDVSATAISLARERGLPVLRRSVFQPLPREGGWGAVLLIDGNVGIGGNLAALLDRCALLMHPDGRIVVETHRAGTRNRAFMAQLVDDLGRTSLPFPWAEVGATALLQHARTAGLTASLQWTVAGRTFVALERA